MRPTEEHKRLISAREEGVPWKKWGPYLSERQWGTVREDYSEGGDACDYFTHDQARSRAYRWGEDGIAGLCDDNQILCFALALWNGADPILKERMFGLTNSEGNGAGLGASHQTGWTGLVAKLIEVYGLLDPKQILAVGAVQAMAEKAHTAA